MTKRKGTEYTFPPHEAPFFEQRTFAQWRLLYCQYLAWFFNRVDMVGLAGRDVVDKPPGLADIYTPIRLKPTDDPEDEESIGDGLSITQALLKYRYLALSGPAGSGKTTIIRYLTRCLSRKEGVVPVIEDLGYRLAVPIFLRELDMDTIHNMDDLLQQWAERLAADISKNDPELPFAIDLDAVRFYMERDWALVMFDGVDELGAVNRRKLRDQIIYPMVRRYPDCYYMVTGRPNGFASCPYHFKEALRNPPDRVFDPADKPAGRRVAAETGSVMEVQPFNDAEIDTFCRRWFALRSPSPRKAEERRAVFFEAVQTNPSLAEMKHRPVFLTILAVVHETHGRLPHSRADAYKMLLQIYLDQLDACRRLAETAGRDVVPAWAHEDKKRILEELAFALHKAAVTSKKKTDLRIEISWDHLNTQLAAILTRLSNEQFNFSLREEFRTDPDTTIARVIQYFLARTGFLVESSHRMYQFSHLSFQEYLCALHIHRGLAQHMFQVEAYLTEHLTDLMPHDGWHETGILFFAHHAQEGGGSQDQLLDRIAPDPMTDGFFAFWIKLLANPDNQISETYRTGALAKIWQWAPALTDLDGHRKLLRAWGEMTLPVQQQFETVLSSFDLNAQEGQMARFLYLCQSIPGYEKTLDLSVMRDWLTRAGHFLGFTGLTVVLDEYHHPELQPLLTRAVPLPMLLLGSGWMFAPSDRADERTNRWLDAARSLLTALALSMREEPHPDLLPAFEKFDPSATKRAAVAASFGLARDRDLALALALARDRDRDLARARARDRDRDLALALALALARDRDLALALARDRDRDLALARDRDRDLALALALALAREKNFSLRSKSFLPKVRLWAALIVFAPTEKTCRHEDISNALTALRDPETHFPRDETDTDASYAFFLNGHQQVFGKDGLFPFALDLNPDTLPEDLWPISATRGHQWFHQQVKTFLRDNGETPPSEQDKP